MEQGEVAEIDTVQAKITFQTRLVDRQEALLNFLNTSILISNYLWDAEGNPLQLEGSVAPIATAGDMAFCKMNCLKTWCCRQSKITQTLLSFPLNSIN